MGDVISIRRQGDNDIYRIFDARGPILPDDLDDKIKTAAARALGKKTPQGDGAFRSACLIVVCLSLLGIVVAQRIQYASVSAPQATVASAAQAGVPLPFAAAKTPQNDVHWRQSEQSWSSHIEQLELELAREKTDFGHAFP